MKEAVTNEVDDLPWSKNSTLVPFVLKMFQHTTIKF